MPFAQLNHNTGSRLAAMGAFCAKGTFEISEYQTWTDDWARTPDGKVYSEKAPGGLIPGVPVYCAISTIHGMATGVWGHETLQERVIREWGLRYIFNLVLTLLLQMIPWLWLVRRWDKFFVERGVSEGGRTFAMLALMFGTTPVFMANVLVGHITVAFWALLVLLAILEKRMLLAGFAMGVAVLSEYSSPLLFPGALLACAAFSFPRIMLGAALPAVIWIIYHTAYFGGPFAIANRFINPIFHDKAAESVQLWGIFGLPNPLILLKLLFGPERGLLFSQPWVLASAIVLPVFARSLPREGKRAFAYAWVSLVLLLLMNSAFGGWHGGPSSGPRYLSAALPLFAVPLALGWGRFSWRLRRILWLTLAASFLTFAFSCIISPTSGMWIDWAGFIAARPAKFAWRAGLFFALVASFVFMARARLRLR